MLKHLGTRNSALLVYVTDENYRDALSFRFTDKGESDLLDVGNTSGRGRYYVRIHSLNGVRNDNVGLYFFSLGEYLFNVGFGENIKIFARYRKTLGAELYLPA